jgi:hypothetical protein
MADNRVADVIRRVKRLAHAPQADVLAVVALLAVVVLHAGLTWARMPLGDDHYWFMQVSARVTAGGVLYRDVTWIYGALPVYLLGLFYQVLGVNISQFLLFGQLLATLACLLTYRAARFLLPAPLALLSTMAAFVGFGGISRWFGSGFLSLVRAHTGAVALGTVLGLAVVVCLLYYLRDARMPWLVAAGAATGLAFLTKPEFALACAGTGVFFLTLIVLFPAGPFEHRAGVRPLIVYVATGALVAGAGYGLLAWQAGWANVWAGVTGFGQTALALAERPPWGTPQSWAYIVSGLGIWLLAMGVLTVIVAPALVRTYARHLVLLAVLGLALLALPWILLRIANTRLSFALVSTFQVYPFRTAIQIVQAPATVLAVLLLVALVVHWFRGYRRRRTIDQITWYLAVLVAYSVLKAARFCFNPAEMLWTQYMYVPLFVFSLVVLLPRMVNRLGQATVQRSRALMVVTLILCVHAVAGFALDMGGLSILTFDLATPRGTVYTLPWGQSGVQTLQYVIARTEPDEAIAVLGANPEFYFLTGRQNPLRQDFIRASVMRLSPTDVDEIIRRLETHQPRLVIVGFWVETPGMSAEELDIEERHLLNWGPGLTPVWQYVQAHYPVRTVFVDDPPRWGYAIYEPR